MWTKDKVVREREKHDSTIAAKLSCLSGTSLGTNRKKTQSPPSLTEQEQEPKIELLGITIKSSSCQQKESDTFFYDIYPGNRDFYDLKSRCIPAKKLLSIAKNYAYLFFLTLDATLENLVQRLITARL